MKTELVNQEIEMVSGGRTATKKAIKKVTKDVKDMSKLARTRKAAKAKKCSPINAYDMIEYNKRNGFKA